METAQKITFIIFIFFTFILTTSASTATASPVIFYSDITSGPITGGLNNKGAFVTICGKNFGASRGASYVSIGGRQADNYPVWSDTKITFQLGANAATGKITVTTTKGTSNGVPFIVRSGNIYFVDRSTTSLGMGTFANPWNSPANYYMTAEAGDICYIRAGTYNGQYGHNNHFNLGIGKEAAEGSPDNEIALVAYPGETVKFEALGQTVNGTDITGNIDLDGKSYYVFSGLQLYSSGRPSIQIATNGNRIINNDCVGNTSFSYGIIQFVSGSYNYIYGNELHGAAAGNKLEHPLYIGGGASNIDFAWNWIHDNDVAEGPLICINQDHAIRDGLTFKNIAIRNNFIDGVDASKHTPRAIGFVAQGYGSYTMVYNNILVNCGGDLPWDYCIYILSGSVDFYNNTIYNTKGTYAFHIYAATYNDEHFVPGKVFIRNNIIYNQKGCKYFLIENEKQMGLIDISYNNYYGNGPSPARDNHAINSNPLFIAPQKYDFHLQPRSPAIDTGTDDVNIVVSNDFDFVSRPQGKGFDIGAFER